MNDGINDEARESKVTSRPGRLWWLIGAATLIVIAGVAVVIFQRPRNGGGLAGREVPSVESASGQAAGREVPTVELASSASPAPAGGKADLTLSPEMVGRIHLKFEEARHQEVANQLRTTGTVQPNAYKETRVTPLVGGRVTAVKVQLGDRVTRGQPLAVIFSQELAEAQMKYLTIIADLKYHTAQFERAQKLAGLGAISRQEFEEAEAHFNEHHAEHAAARQRLLLLGLTQSQIDAIRDASHVRSEVTVPAPSSGVITARSVNTGQVVTMSDALFSVTDLSSVWVIGNVYEKDFSIMRVGARVTVTAPAYPGRTFAGTISYIDPRVDPQSRTAQARIEVPNPGQMLRLGMFVDVSLGAPGRGGQAVVIPRSALQAVGNDQVVFVPLGPGQFQMRKVQTAEDAGEFVRVVGGVSAGEKVVTEGSFFLRAEMARSGSH
ncbi:MAG TPA: efflux RND transporter periplasmic adaptor subunit [Blastocatellia bacterium]|nr:efflux RND transporter periplasmic adaptor subunit [Blastocatellia bacterium]